MEMKSMLISLDQHTSSRFENVPAKLLIKCSDYLCHPLEQIFNISIERSGYPDLFKYNNVIPIYKNKGAKKSSWNSLAVNLSYLQFIITIFKNRQLY